MGYKTESSKSTRQTHKEKLIDTDNSMWLTKGNVLGRLKRVKGVKYMVTEGN